MLKWNKYEARKTTRKNYKGLKKIINTYSIQMKAKKFWSDLEKRCHYHSTTNVKGDSHESAYYGRTT